MKSIYDDIRQGYLEYLTYIQKNPRITLPQHIHDPALSTGKIHASSLGRCPLAAARKRELEVKYDLSTLHLMQQGIRDAEPLQEALLWYDPTTLVEHSVERDTLRGRIDILYQGQVIEIKRRDGYIKALPQPRLTDAYQLIAYSYITGLTEIHLCLMTRFDLHFWKMVNKENGFVLVDESGNEWKNASNKPSYLNYGVLKYETQRHLDYLNGVRVEDPLPDFLNIPAGTECGRWAGTERPKKYKTSYKGETERKADYIPTCPFWCHCDISEEGLIKVEETEYGSQTYRIAPD